MLHSFNFISLENSDDLNKSSMLFMNTMLQHHPKYVSGAFGMSPLIYLSNKQSERKYLGYNDKVT